MKDVASLLNDMAATGVVTNYAIFGAVAQMRYTEAVATMDADVLVALPGEGGLDLLQPIYAYCRSKGYHPDGEAIRVGKWPVQFIPAFDALTESALADAETGDIDGVPLRVVRADYLAVLALHTGRAKDYARILALLETGAVTSGAIEQLAEKHGLQSRWTQFRDKFLEA